MVLKHNGSHFLQLDRWQTAPSATTPTTPRRAETRAERTPAKNHIIPNLKSCDNYNHPQGETLITALQDNCVHLLGVAPGRFGVK